MKSAIAWMAGNSVAANLLMLVLLLGGLFGLFRMKQEVFPDFKMDTVLISVAYPGASPNEVEQGMILAIEEVVNEVDGVKRLSSSSGEGGGYVMAELLVDADVDQALSDIKTVVDRIQSFPEESELPRVSMLSARRDVINLVIAGDQDLATLHALVEESRSALLESPDITQVEVFGVPPLEVSIEVPRERLEQYGLTLEGIAMQVRASSLELPGGDVDTRRGELLIRVADRALMVDDFEGIVLRSSETGSQVLLGDIADIEDGYEDSDLAYTYNGKPAVRLTAYRIGDETPIKVAAAVRQYSEELASRLPEDSEVAIWADDSRMLRGRIDLLVKNAQIGLFLVVIILALFLELRLAFWVAMGIPITFLGAFFFLPTIDLSINMVSLFAFIITLGLVVDDAIIVGENVYEKHERGMAWKQAAVAGAQEMAMPVSFAILTTLAAFSPMLFVPGFMGKIFFMVPAVAITVLSLSLAESFFILPAHLAHASDLFDSWIFAPIHMARRRVSAGLKWFTTQPFRRLLEWMLHWRYAATAAGVSTLIITGALLKSGAVPFIFFPDLEGDVVTATVRLPYGTPAEQTRSVADLLEASLAKAADEAGSEILEGQLVRIGEGPLARGPREQGGHLVTIEAQLIATEGRDIGSVEFADLWESLSDPPPGVESMVFSAAAGPHAGSPIGVQLSHRDPEKLQAASEELVEILQGFSELTSVENSFASGKSQLDFQVASLGSQLGLSSLSIGSQLRNAFFGAEALREQRGRQERKVMVRLPESQRGSVHDLESLRIRTPDGGDVPLTDVADATLGRSPTQISREDGQQIITVGARLKPEAKSSSRVLGAMNKTHFPELMERYPGLEIELVGEQREQAETNKSLGQNGILALLAIYALLAIPFRSYTQPLLIMSVIPFGLVGAVVGHILMGYKMSMVSSLGLVALTGVVVNDSLVLLDAAQRSRRAGLSRISAIIAASQRRLRPILLTSLTTFFGLAPMILETDLQARFLIPMALSLGFGVLFATVVVLLLLPCFYLILADFMRPFRGEQEDSDSAPGEDLHPFPLDQATDHCGGQAATSA